jgi:hypothetical protein
MPFEIELKWRRAIRVGIRPFHFPDRGLEKIDWRSFQIGSPWRLTC